MKTHFLALAISAVLPLTCAASDTNGFLVIEIDRHVYNTSDGKGTEPDIKQSFKIPITPEFLANFKKLPNDHSQGTGLCCTTQFEKPKDGPGFTWWLERSTNHGWYAHMWIALSNPSVTEGVAFKHFEDIEMFYEKSFVSGSRGENTSFTAKYLTAEQMSQGARMPTVAIKKTDQSYLFPGEISTNCPVKMSGLFQEN